MHRDGTQAEKGVWAWAGHRGRRVFVCGGGGGGGGGAGESSSEPPPQRLN